MKPIFSKKMIVALMVLILQCERGFACDACYSLSDDPIYMQSYERNKAYLGFSKSDSFTPLDEKGQESVEIGPISRNTTTIGLGRQISERTSLSLTAPYISNRRNGYERSGWGDPIATLHGLVAKSDGGDFWSPQIQVHASVRSGQATSVYDYSDPSRLDIFGSGTPQGRLSADIWSAALRWKVGSSQVFEIPLASRRTEFGDVRDGWISRSTIIGGYGWTDRELLLAGLSHEQTTAKTSNGEARPDTESSLNRAFIFLELKVAHESKIRFAAVRNAAFGFNKNTVKSDSVTVATIKSF